MRRTLVFGGSGLVASLSCLAIGSPQAVAGDGTFGAPVVSATDATNPVAVAAGDFNNDGRQDFAMADFTANSVLLRLGDGSGGYSSPAGMGSGVGTHPVALAVADIDHNGNEDVVTVNRDGDSISVISGGGNGFFFGAQNFSGMGGRPTDAAFGDFNEDGNVDIVIVDSLVGRFTLRQGNGSTGMNAFTTDLPGSLVGVPGAAQAVIVDDFNNDGHDDVAVASSTRSAQPGAVTIRLGQGTGQMTAAPNAHDGPDLFSLASGDFNGDGNVDLAITTTTGIDIRLGVGNGSFTTPAGSPYALGNNVCVCVITVGDFNSDGNLDLATANQQSHNVTVRLGAGDGTFPTQATGSPITTGGAAPFDIAVADPNRDGNEDLIVPNFSTPNVVTLPGKGAAADSGNLLVNGGGEATPPATASRKFLTDVTPPPGWTTTQSFTNVRYGADGGFPNRLIAARFGGQEAFFSGGLGNQSSSAAQTVDVSSSADLIDADRARITLSGYLGGFRARPDSMQVTAVFKGAGGGALGDPLQIGPVTLLDRRDQTTMIRRSAAVTVPAKTRTITVTMTANHLDNNTYTNGYADRLGLFLSEIPPGGGGPPGGGDDDTTPPETTITKEPKNKSSKKKAKYKFVSSEASSTFQCKFDRKPFKPCSSPRKYKRLDFGKHKFKVVATDAAGNTDPSPDKDKFKRK